MTRAEMAMNTQAWIVALSLIACGGAAREETGGDTTAHAEASDDGDTDESDGEDETPPVPEALVAVATAASEAARSWMTEAAARPITPTCELAPVYYPWTYEWDEDAGEHVPALDGRLGPEALAVLDWDVRCLSARGSTGVELTGMVWSFGTDEYAMAIGSRLAHAVRTALLERGVAADQITLRSVGGEMATGSDPLGWTRDVRVELR